MGALRILIFLTTLVNLGISIPLLDKFEDEPIFVRSMKTDPNYRLPDGKTKNVKYGVEIIPYLKTGDDKEFTFEGQMRMTFMVTENNINKLVMNSMDLKFETQEITGFDTVSIENENTTYQMVTFKLDSKTFVPNIQYVLYVKYTGKIQDDMTGFYRSSYIENNRTEWLAATQFQPVYARKVFPCFDEPEYKAKFTISIQCPESYNCVSNMPNSTVINRMVKFQETPTMSTYLIAFIVSKFEKAAMSDDPQKEFSIYARPDAKGMGEYPFQIGSKIVEEMSNFTNIDYYQMNHGAKMKMDQAALPDFSAGAMENWGLLTYREASLMIDPKESSTRHKLSSATILAHEIAHMWFGDLVTCDWWSNTWLNEGFASYFQYNITHVVDSDFGLDDQFVGNQVQTALRYDSSSSSWPLTAEVNSPEEIDAHFGTISYQKGATVIRMMSHWLGQDTFKKGLQYYLGNNSYTNVKPEQLYEAFQHAAEEDNVDLNGLSVNDVMGSWVSQAGYPVLKVITEENGFKISQERFVNVGEDNGKNVYHVPLTYTTSNDSDFESTKPVMFLGKDEITIPGEGVEWILLNTQQTGYYRVLYDDTLYTSIIQELYKNKTIHKYNRAQIIDDAIAFAKEEVIEYSKMLDIIQFLENDDDYVTWSSAFSGFSYLRKIFMTFEDTSERLDKHILTLMDTTIKSLGFEPIEGETKLNKIFRANVLNWACNLHHKQCVETATKLFAGSVIDPDSREYVYCTGLRHGNGTDFDNLWNKHQNSNVVNEKIVILNALGCTDDQEKVKEYLMKTLEADSGIRSQDRMTAFNSALTGNRANVNTTYTFFTSNVKSIKQIYGNRSFNGMFSSIASRMNKEELTEFEDSLDKINDLTEDDKNTANKAIENARKQLEWTEKMKTGIDAWLTLKYNSASLASSSLLLMTTLMMCLYLWR